MQLPKKLETKIEKISKPVSVWYPIVIIVSIPLLLILNTVWNLRTFNRDINFFIRHQATNIANTIKLQLVSNIDNVEKLDELTKTTKQNNEEIADIAILKVENQTYKYYAGTMPVNERESAEKSGLNSMAIGLNNPIAGLSYDPSSQKNLWNVSVPINEDKSALLFLKMKTDAVDTLLSRTARDSYLILSVLVVITLILLSNHFLFYTKAMKAREIEELNVLKDEFISIAAHELRAPMTGLVGYLELLRAKISPDYLPKVEEDLTTLDSLTQDLNNLIDELLDVSRIEQGRLKVETKETNVNEIIDKVIMTFTPVAKSQNLAIIFEKIDLPLIQSDPNRIRQIITNLTSNAIKYSQKGSITILVSNKGSEFEISVKDTGIGIPADKISTLFTKFSRIRDEKTMEVRGTGLGLWITKQIVEMLGGKIFVQSIYGSGSVFTFTLPFSVISRK